MSDFSKKPVIIFIEITKACLLSCKHCRAKAIRKRSNEELTLDQITLLIDQIRAFEKPYPIVIITGGDPLMRSDIFDIIQKFTDSGIKTFIAFSGTKLADENAIKKFKTINITGLSVSIDGSNAEIHDEFRGVKGTYDISMNILENCNKEQLNYQINTTVWKGNLYDLPALLKLVTGIKANRWDLFFLIKTGRAKGEYSINPEEAEDVLKWLALIDKKIPMSIKVTEAPFYNRVKMMNAVNGGALFNYLCSQTREIINGNEIKNLYVTKDSKNLGVVDGRGIIFISNTGEVYPSGFLPVSSGNIKNINLTDIYNHSEPFLSIKSPVKLKGKCSRCEYKEICGGSRARAYAEFGDYLESDPLCIYNGGV
ncbi:MAG: TIGR04053 family radical SAM/SPASM domain-containing protein [Candidatus Thermoplasmatota archaeon]|nr:TIGR04053 family radical SAM/SPASM domain-containing protein [Candidatus Thermoplasmatota archaeon]MCL5963837.1 TIGR04053 family radical SAM/SPASM domain-containing protein [Candidatus Thermoplasmatota archaeon]